MAVTSAVRRLGAGVVAVAVIAGAVTVTMRLRHHHPPAPSCSVHTTRATYTLDLEQAAQSTTIAAVGKRLGLPDHAVTVALAAALQESGLHNLPFGDRDSLGLFQQRPSQGWGTSTEILTPSYAAAAFYRALEQVDGWATMPVTDAAQRVQRSGAPTAYAQWAAEAEALAIAMTGEAAAGLSCRFSLARTSNPVPTLTAGMSNELGVSSLDTTFTSPRGWTVASWIVGHAQQYRVTDVTFRGREWRASSGAWRTVSPSDSRVRFVQQVPES